VSHLDALRLDQTTMTTTVTTMMTTVTINTTRFRMTLVASVAVLLLCLYSGLCVHETTSLPSHSCSCC